MSTEVDRTEVERILRLLRLEDRRQVVRYCRQLVITGDALLQVIVAGRHAGLHGYVYDCHFSIPRPGDPEPLNPRVRNLVALAANGLVPLNRDVGKATRLLAASFDRPRGLAAHLLYDRSRRNWHLFCFNHDQSGESRVHYSRHGFSRRPLARVWRDLCAGDGMPRSIGIRYRGAPGEGSTEPVDTAPKPA